jgi:hypothetical protein
MIEELLNKFPLQSIWSLFGVGATSGTLVMAERSEQIEQVANTSNHAESLYFICGALCFLGGFLVSIKTIITKPKDEE